MIFNYARPTYTAIPTEAHTYRYVVQPQLPVEPEAPARKRISFSLGLDHGPQTVDRILQRGYMDCGAGDAETGLLEDKQHTAWLGLDDILGQIRLREDIYKKNMLEIAWSECYAFNELARGWFPATPQQWEVYHRQLQDLGLQKRRERITAWQDMSRLRQLLPESIGLYLSASRKSDLLRDLDGDAL